MPVMTHTGTIELTPMAGANASDLHCPRCGSLYLHQLGIKVFHRREDGENVAVITVDGAKAGIELAPNTSSGNPSARRHGLSIEFSCEECSDAVFTHSLATERNL
jgi:hypothetical protein